MWSSISSQSLLEIRTDWVNLRLAGRASPRDFPRAKPKGNPEEQPCQPEENPVLPDSVTQIYILFLICFHIGPAKMHRRFHIGLPKINRWFCIGPPKIHRRFRIGPPQVTLNLIMQEKQQNFQFEIEWPMCWKFQVCS